jgi:hypothetical protein
MSGAVERSNGAGRDEFYETYDLPSGVEQLNPILDSYQHLYNHHRPQGALAGTTPDLARNQPGHPRRPTCPEPGHSIAALGLAVYHPTGSMEDSHVHQHQEVPQRQISR